MSDEAPKPPTPAQMLREMDVTHKRMHKAAWLQRASALLLLISTTLNLAQDRWVSAAFTGTMMVGMIYIAETRWVKWRAQDAELRARIARLEQPSPPGDSP